MATITRGYTFGATEQVTATKLHNLADLASVSNIVNADVYASADIVDTKLHQISTAGKVSGTALVNLEDIDSGAGVIPIANLATGTPDGTKYIRDDGTLQTVTVPVKSTGTEIDTGTDDAKFVTPKAIADAISLKKIKFGTFTKDLSDSVTSQAITGVGFQPSAVIILSTNSFGMADGTRIHCARGNAVSSPSLLIYFTNGTWERTVTAATMDADGFTLTWAKVGSPTGTETISYVAID